MSVPAYVTGFKTFGYHTESAGTVIQSNIPGQSGRRIGLIELLYTAAATAHTASLMYAPDLAGCRTTASAAAASGQAVLNVTDAPTDPAGNAVASGDHIAYQLSDGTWEFNTVASLAVKAITLTNNIGTPGVAIGGLVRIFGVVADGAIINFAMAAAATTEYGAGKLVAAMPIVGDPAILQVNNVTNAGFLLNALFVYMQK